MKLFSSVIAEVSSEVVNLLPSACTDANACEANAIDGHQAISCDLRCKAKFIEFQLASMRVDASVVCNPAESLKVCGSWEQLLEVYWWLYSLTETKDMNNVHISSNSELADDTEIDEKQGRNTLKSKRKLKKHRKTPIAVHSLKTSRKEWRAMLNDCSQSPSECELESAIEMNSSLFNNHNQTNVKDECPDVAHSESEGLDESYLEMSVSSHSITPSVETRSRTKTHMSKKSSEEDLGCDRCEFVASKERYLLFHKLRVHGKRELQCNLCERSFAVLKDLNQHVRLHSVQFCCEQCGKTLKSKYALMLHIARIHNGSAPKPVKNYLCTLCGKMCRSKTDYNAHRNKEHLGIQPFKCEVCDAGFHARANLRTHEQIHSDNRKFVCEHCEKSFKQRQGLRTHLAIHAINRPFQCDRCAKTFTQKGALIRHERTHTSSRPFVCSQCPATFNDCSILRRHLVGIHKVSDADELKGSLRAACDEAKILIRTGTVDACDTNELAHHHHQSISEDRIDEQSYTEMMSINSI